MNPVFNHQKLKVYQKALACCAELEALSESWDAVHAIADHLPRAAEGVVLNIAEASAANTGAKIPLLDSSLGSTLECAACLDIGVIKGLVNVASAVRLKQDLLEIFRMLVGLRKAWQGDCVREEPVAYNIGENIGVTPSVFYHENLDVYRTALAIVRSFHVLGTVGPLPKQRFRDLDTHITSVVLNIAEGNGRFSGADHCRFVETAHRAAIKVAAQFDLCEQRKLITSDFAAEVRTRLVRIASMTGALTEYLRT